MQRHDPFEQYEYSSQKKAGSTSNPRVRVSAAWRSLCGALAPFQDYQLLLFLGGPEFNEHLIDKALTENVLCISTNGTRYDVLDKNND
jgi:hypothetical protein